MDRAEALAGSFALVQGLLPLGGYFLVDRKRPLEMQQCPFRAGPYLFLPPRENKCDLGFKPS
jgi:hypothetical protein